MSSYGDSLKAGATSGADWEEAKVMKTYDQDGDDVASKDGEDVVKKANLFIFSEIAKV